MTPKMRVVLLLTGITAALAASTLSLNPTLNTVLFGFGLMALIGAMMGGGGC
ncbi:hypothetical protein JOC37_002042 [Desulfohalotomaculum tongense]|uniref:hypothetical protein n=1 Tax=Desulforadius tongensis TaxID=1216062 RepID=UPI00195BF7C7|nr:hypothetical protein [Desulforadius tongensis]MBM7855640.1 hypothetical protein [Desulforadius tongensis]